MGLTTDGKLIGFDTATPGTLISGPTAIAGLPAGETLVALDVRPATSQLYGVGRSGRLYLISADCATVTAITVGTFDTPLSGAEVGADFNPTSDRIRIVDTDLHNFRVHPVTGAQVDGDGIAGGIQPDAAIHRDPADPDFAFPLSLSAIAYDRSFTTTSATTLYGIDTAHDALVTVGGVDGTPSSPNGGAVFSRPGGGLLGVNATGTSSLDIRAAGTPAAFAALQTGGTSSGLYSVALPNGPATLVGTVGPGDFTVQDIAVDAALPAPCGLPSAADTTGPEILIDVQRVLPLKKASKGVAFGYSCDEACTINATLGVKKKNLGSATSSLGQAGVGAGKITVTKAGKKVLKRAKKNVKASLVLNATDTTGNAASLTRKLTLER
ncbi:MAG: hypothetical protein QOG62_310 [Thermoleophilaceae bacterium]|jgi:hypothetical protein|nr:hypothetical protein [Thermoleophilaceae bacterium]